METKNHSAWFNSPMGTGVLILALVLLVAAAKPLGTVQIGVLDSKRVAAESQTIRAMITDAAAKAEKMRGELEKNRTDLTARLDAYSAQKTVIGDEEKERRETAIEKLKDEIEVQEIRLNREIKRSQESMAGPMGLKILAAVREVSDEMGLEVVLTTQDVVHHNASCDITAHVIKKLDKK